MSTKPVPVRVPLAIAAGRGQSTIGGGGRRYGRAQIGAEAAGGGEIEGPRAAGLLVHGEDDAVCALRVLRSHLLLDDIAEHALRVAPDRVAVAVPARHLVAEHIASA